MSAVRRLLAVAAAGAALAACGTLLTPFETLPMPSGSDARQRVGICYDGLASTPEEVRAAAQESCAPNTLEERVDTDYQIQYCPVLLPGRATFACTPRR